MFCLLFACTLTLHSDKTDWENEYFDDGMRHEMNDLFGSPDPNSMADTDLDATDECRTAIDDGESSSVSSQSPENRTGHKLARYAANWDENASPRLTQRTPSCSSELDLGDVEADPTADARDGNGLASRPTGASSQGNKSKPRKKDQNTLRKAAAFLNMMRSGSNNNTSTTEDAVDDDRDVATALGNEGEGRFSLGMDGMRSDTLSTMEEYDPVTGFEAEEYSDYGDVLDMLHGADPRESSTDIADYDLFQRPHTGGSMSPQPSLTDSNTYSTAFGCDRLDALYDELSQTWLCQDCFADPDTRKEINEGAYACVHKKRIPNPHYTNAGDDRGLDADSVPAFGSDGEEYVYTSVKNNYLDFQAPKSSQGPDWPSNPRNQCRSNPSAHSRLALLPGARQPPPGTQVEDFMSHGADFVGMSDNEKPYSDPYDHTVSASDPDSPYSNANPLASRLRKKRNQDLPGDSTLIQSPDEYVQFAPGPNGALQPVMPSTATAAAAAATAATAEQQQQNTGARNPKRSVLPGRPLSALENDANSAPATHGMSSTDSNRYVHIRTPTHSITAAAASSTAQTGTDGQHDKQSRTSDGNTSSSVQPSSILEAPLIWGMDPKPTAVANNTDANTNNNSSSNNNRNSNMPTKQTTTGNEDKNNTSNEPLVWNPPTSKPTDLDADNTAVDQQQPQRQSFDRTQAAHYQNDRQNNGRPSVTYEEAGLWHELGENGHITRDDGGLPEANGETLQVLDEVLADLTEERWQGGSAAGKDISRDSKSKRLILGKRKGKGPKQPAQKDLREWQADYDEGGDDYILFPNTDAPTVEDRSKLQQFKRVISSRKNGGGGGSHKVAPVSHSAMAGSDSDSSEYNAMGPDGGLGRSDHAMFTFNDTVNDVDLHGNMAEEADAGSHFTNKRIAHLRKSERKQVRRVKSFNDISSKPSIATAASVDSIVDDILVERYDVFSEDRLRQPGSNADNENKEEGDYEMFPADMLKRFMPNAQKAEIRKSESAADVFGRGLLGRRASSEDNGFEYGMPNNGVPSFVPASSGDAADAYDDTLTFPIAAGASLPGNARLAGYESAANIAAPSAEKKARSDRFWTAGYDDVVAAQPKDKTGKKGQKEQRESIDMMDEDLEDDDDLHCIIPTAAARSVFISAAQKTEPGITAAEAIEREDPYALTTNLEKTENTSLIKQAEHRIVSKMSLRKKKGKKADV